MSLILSYDTNLKFGLVRFGSGIIFSGNFGGNDIQNFYHNMTSIDNIDIPYSNENYFGLAVHSLVKPKIFHKNNFQLNGVTSISLFSGGGPNSIELGLESNYYSTSTLDIKAISIQIEILNHFLGKEFFWEFFQLSEFTMKFNLLFGLPASIWNRKPKPFWHIVLIFYRKISSNSFGRC